MPRQPLSVVLRSRKPQQLAGGEHPLAEAVADGAVVAGAAVFALRAYSQHL